MKKNYNILRKGWFLLLVLISSFAFGQTTVPYSAPGTYTFTVPAGVTSLKIEAWGAGSGGNNNISRGGGGGAFAGDNIVGVIPGATYQVRVGAGAAAGTGNSGQDSSFGSLVIAKGGNGFAGGSASASTGAIKYNGGNGGTSFNTGGAGGGGSAGRGGAGGNGADTTNTIGGAGGAAGSGGGAAGGNGGSTINNGANGAFPGGGGGERGSNGTTIGSGAGGDGQVIITYTPAYVAQIISADTGSTTWCPGETRNVTVTIKNIGTQPWTDVKGPGSKDFNIGIKWNTNGSSWADYHVRVDADNLAPGATKTYTFPITASNYVNGLYTTALGAGTNNLTFDVVYEGVAWFAWNSSGVGPGNVKYTTPNQNITNPPAIGNNVLGYGTAIGTTTTENADATLTALAGNYFSSVNFASYGTPNGMFPNFTIGTCHAVTSHQVVESRMLGVFGAVSIAASNAIFTDPCSGTLKRLYISASYAQPVCSGSSVNITGSAPSGGSGTYSYLWESSTSSAISGFAPAAGVNSGVNYTTTALTQDTWFRRVITSCNQSSTSAVVLVKVNPLPTITLAAASASVCQSTSAQTSALTYSGATGSPATYSIAWNSTPANNFAAVTNATLSAGSISIVIPANTPTGTYTGTLTVKNAAGCISSGKSFSVTVNNKPTIGTVAALPILCAGVQYSSPTPPTVTTNGSNITSSGWEISTTQDGNTFVAVAFPYTASITDNGKLVRYTATNSCGTTVSNTVSLTVNDKPTIAAITAPMALCAGSSLNPTAPNVTPNGSALSSQGWEISTTSGGSTYTALTVPYNVAFADNGKNNRYTATNTCGITTSNVAVLTVNNKPTIAAITTPTALCAGSSLNLTAPTVTANGSALSSQGWEISTASGGSTYTALTVPYTVTFADNGKNIRYTASNSCGIITSNVVVLAVTDKPTIAAISTPTALCAGNSFNPATPSVTANSSVLSSQGWQISTTVGGSVYTALTVPYTVAFADNGKNIRYTATNGCGITNSNVVVLIVTDKPTIAAITAPAALCAGSSFNPTAPTVTANGSVVTSQGWQLETGVGSGSFSNLTVPYTVTYADNEKKIRYYATNGCGTTYGNSVVLTVNPILTASVSISTPTNIICVGANAPLTFTAAPTNGGTPTYQWRVNGSQVTGATGTTFTTSTLAPGDVVTVQMTSNANPCLAGSTVTSNTITMATQTTIYKSATGWTVPPAPNLSAEIQASYSSSLGNLDVCSLLVTNGAAVTIATGGFFKVQNGINVNSGILTVESDGNLVQGLDVPVPPNTGTITVKRNIKFRNDDRQEYNYLISPVVGQTLKTIYPGVPTTSTYPYVLYHNEATNYFSNSSGAYIAARGLAVKEPSKAHVGGDNIDAVFQGAPGNGIFNYTLAFTNGVQYGYNLVGNPYPSNIDLQKLYILNGGSLTSTTPGKITSTFYFWDNRANDRYVQDGSNYSGRAYAVYNAYNDTGNAAGYLLNPEQILTANKPIKIAKVGQGFMVRATGAESMIFNNSIRVADNTGASFLSKEPQNPVNRYWLRLVSPVKAVNTVAVVYFEGGSNAFGMDDSTLNADSSDMLYTMAESRKLQIEGKPIFTLTDKVILGSRQYAAGNYTFALDKTEGIFAAGQRIYLKDKQTGIITDLTQGSYTFAANPGDSTGRFEIIYQPETVLATDSTTKEELHVYKDGADFVVKAKSNNIKELELYDLSGRLLYKAQPNSTTAVIESNFMVNGTYVLKINHNGRITARKIIK